MADNKKTDHGRRKTKEQYDKQAEELSDNATGFKKRTSGNKTGKLKGNVKIVLVIGIADAGKISMLKLMTGQDLRLGHKLDDGTPILTCIPVEVDGERYIFIDSPGFGYGAVQPGVIKKQIQHMLGFLPRTLGGIHAILYVQDITVERNTVGMGEAIGFLDELAGREIGPHITFITTKWDIPQSAAKLMHK